MAAPAGAGPPSPPVVAGVLVGVLVDLVPGAGPELVDVDELGGAVAVGAPAAGIPGRPVAVLPRRGPGVSDLPLPPLEPRALSAGQVRSLKSVLDRLERSHQHKGRRRGGQAGVHGHGRPLRDRAIVYLLLSTGLRREELVRLDLRQLQPDTRARLRAARKAKISGARGTGGPGVSLPRRLGSPRPTLDVSCADGYTGTRLVLPLTLITIATATHTAKITQIRRTVRGQLSKALRTVRPVWRAISTPQPDLWCLHISASPSLCNGRYGGGYVVGEPQPH